MAKFIAHRGNDNHQYKENTKEAIWESLKRDYISGVEFDIRMTKDKKIVIIHNCTISQASDGWGFVKHMNLKELRKYNFGTKNNPARIATLEQVLSGIRCDKKIVIEIKEETDKFKLLVDKLLKIVKKNKNLNLYFCSFNHKLIEYFKKKSSYIKAGVVFLLATDIDKTNLYSDFYVINYLYLDKIKTDKEIMIWTIDSIKQYRKIRINLTNNMYVITDKAYLLKEK